MLMVLICKLLYFDCESDNIFFLIVILFFVLWN